MRFRSLEDIGKNHAQILTESGTDLKRLSTKHLGNPDDLVFYRAAFETGANRAPMFFWYEQRRLQFVDVLENAQLKFAVPA